MDFKQRIYTVGEFTQYVKHRLEGDPVLSDIEIKGEISNLTRHGSGHVYFSLKDPDAQVSCAMFKGVAIRYQRDLPGHGEKVEVRGRISVYPPRGNYQLIVSEIRRAGLGDLHQQFLELRDRLRKEGLFDPQHKLHVPQFPRVIGVATSPTGAVIRDILNTIRRLYPHVKVVLAPTKVQGPGAAESIVRSLQLLNNTREIDTIILARGGGSLEDLWCFNEEIVARAIFDSEKPVISGVGHETDTTIADFVADLRASTPTAAAEQAVPDAAGIREWLSEAEAKMKRSLQHFIDFRRQMLDDYTQRMRLTLENRLQKARHELEMANARLQSLDLRQVLRRGFTVSRVAGQTVKSVEGLQEGQEIETIFADGKTQSVISKIEKGKNEK